MAKLFPRVEFPFFAEARGLMISSQVTISICWSVIRNKQVAEICHKEHFYSMGARRSSRSQNPDPSSIKNLELTHWKNMGEECLMDNFPPNSHLLCPLTLESQMKVPLVIKVPRPQFWFAVLLRYPNESTASPNLVCGTIGGTLGHG